MRLLVGQLLELARTENVNLRLARLDFNHLTTGEVLPFEALPTKGTFHQGRDTSGSLDRRRQHPAQTTYLYTY